MDALLAAELGLTPTFRVDLATAAGTTRVPGGRVAEVSLGTAKANGQEFLFTHLDGVHTLSGKIQGVLGQEFLSHFDYLLDLHGKRLVFGGDAPVGSRIPFQLLDGRMAVPTNLGRLVLDSGTDIAVVFHGSAGGATAGIRTASGFAAAQQVPAVRLRIGERDYRSPAAFVTRPDAREDGLAPVGLFRSVFVSNSGGYVVMAP
jgi:hypothetical protein